MSDHLESSYSKWLKSHNDLLEKMREEIEINKSLYNLINSVPKGGDYLGKKQATIQQLENMGYYILDNSEYTTVQLKTKEGFVISFMMFPCDFELDNIIELVVRRMNGNIVNAF